MFAQEISGVLNSSQIHIDQHPEIRSEEIAKSMSIALKDFIKNEITLFKLSDKSLLLLQKEITRFFAQPDHQIFFIE